MLSPFHGKFDINYILTNENQYWMVELFSHKTEICTNLSHDPCKPAICRNQNQRLLLPFSFCFPSFALASFVRHRTVRTLQAKQRDVRY